MNRNNMARSRSTYSTYACIGLLIVIGILGYKYFEHIKYSNQLKDQIYSFDSMVNQLKFEKNSIDKEKSTCLDTVKSMQSHMDDFKQNLNRKDVEIRDLFQYKLDNDQKLVNALD
jgi:hypothetical protein